MYKKLQAEHSAIKEKIEGFLKDELSPADLKHTTAPFGIYQQKNDLFMTRIRVTGGHLEASKLRTIAGIMKTFDVGFAHFTSREDIQLHNVPAKNVYDLVRACTENDLPFKGGGGDTFRNILVASDSGLTEDCLFDVMPYAKSLTPVIFSWDKAFSLPRKLKIGFSDSPSNELIAAVQDLGFAARIVDGKRGFKVYGGGGMGRESTLGVTLFEFIPAEDVPKCALAMTELFDAHGDRTKRSAARIRFIVKRLGAEKFIELYKEYYDKVECEPFRQLVSGDIEDEIGGLKKYSPVEAIDKDYSEWSQYAVTPTCFDEDIVSVRLFVPNGNLSAEQLEKLDELAGLTGAPCVRITPAEDMILPLVHRSALPVIYNFLKNELSDIDLTLKSFVGHIITCIGATICKIGVLDSPHSGKLIGERLDKYFEDRPELKAANAVRILDAVKVSGCPNCCTGHPSALIGLQGQKKKFDGAPEPVYKFFLRKDEGKLELAAAEDDVVKEADVPDKVLSILFNK